MQYLFKTCCLISKHLDFFLETLLLGFNLITAELENIFCLFSKFLKFMEAFLITQNKSYFRISFYQTHPPFTVIVEQFQTR